MGRFACPSCGALIEIDGIEPTDEPTAGATELFVRAFDEHREVCAAYQVPALAEGELVELTWERACRLSEDQMSPEMAVFYYVEHVNMEVMNGGLVQYFMNTRGDEIDEARASLHTIGAPSHLEVFDRAAAIWREERAIPGSCWETELDLRAFHESGILALEDDWTDDITDIEIVYIRAHPAAFGA